MGVSCCCETSQELLGAPFPAGAGHGCAGGSGRALVLCRDSNPAWSCLWLGHCTPSLCCTAMPPANRNGSHWSDTPRCYLGLFRLVISSALMNSLSLAVIPTAKLLDCTPYGKVSLHFVAKIVSLFHTAVTLAITGHY